MDALLGLLALPLRAARSTDRALLWALLLPAVAPAQTALLRQSEVEVIRVIRLPGWPQGISMATG